MTGTRFKEAFKTALAMVLAYGIALSWGWENPHWAGIAVAMISLPTAGQSIEKGAMRLLGTLVGSFAALTLIALYPQDRWFFMTCASIYIGFCAYMIPRTRYDYFWFVSGFVALVICVGAGPNAPDAFNTAVNRTLETGLGIVVYTMFAVFLWPQSSASQLQETARRLLGSQKKLFETYRDAGDREESQGKSPRGPVQEAQLHANLAQLLNAAASESFEVREHRVAWLRLHQESGALLRALESWRESFPEISHLDLERLVPNLQRAYGDIAKIFDEIEVAWSGRDSNYDPPRIELELDRSEILHLSHLERAAVTVTKSNLERIASHFKALLENVRALKGLAQPVAHGRQPMETIPRVSSLDPDRLGAVVKVMATFWVSFLIWVYIDPPGHAGFMQIAGTFALALVMLPQARPSMLFMPFAIGSLFAGGVYLLLMPRLSGYLELAAVLFAGTFIIYFLFSEPRQGLARLGGIVSLLVLTSVENQQSYSFSQFANTTSMILLSILFLTALSYVPNSPRPEKVFLRLLNRFINCGAYLLERPDHTGWRQRWLPSAWRSDHCGSNLRNLPGKLGQVSQGIDYRCLSPNSRDQVQALVATIHTLNVRFHVVEEAHRYLRSNRITNSLRDDMAAWRHSLVSLFQDWSNFSPPDKYDDLAKRLQLGLAKIEARIEDSFKSLEGESLDDESYLDAYRLLGSYRGLTEAVLAYAKVSNGIDWSRWREARF